jgi:hypothetical protein
MRPGDRDARDDSTRHVPPGFDPPPPIRRSGADGGCPGGRGASRGGGTLRPAVAPCRTGQVLGISVGRCGSRGPPPPIRGAEGRFSCAPGAAPVRTAMRRRSWSIRARQRGGCSQEWQRRYAQDRDEGAHLGTDVDGHGDEQDGRRDDGPGGGATGRARSHSRGSRPPPCSSRSRTASASGGSSSAAMSATSVTASAGIMANVSASREAARQSSDMRAAHGPRMRGVYSTTSNRRPR